jgi:hypothetical protein
MMTLKSAKICNQAIMSFNLIFNLTYSVKFLLYFFFLLLKFIKKKLRLPNFTLSVSPQDYGQQIWIKYPLLKILFTRISETWVIWFKNLLPKMLWEKIQIEGCFNFQKQKKNTNSLERNLWNWIVKLVNLYLFYTVKPPLQRMTYIFDTFIAFMIVFFFFWLTKSWKTSLYFCLYINIFWIFYIFWPDKKIVLPLVQFFCFWYIVHNSVIFDSQILNLSKFNFIQGTCHKNSYKSWFFTSVQYDLLHGEEDV